MDNKVFQLMCSHFQTWVSDFLEMPNCLPVLVSTSWNSRHFLSTVQQGQRKKTGKKIVVTV